MGTPQKQHRKDYAILTITCGTIVGAVSGIVGNYLLRSPVIGVRRYFELDWMFVAVYGAVVMLLYIECIYLVLRCLLRFADRDLHGAEHFATQS